MSHKLKQCDTCHTMKLCNGTTCKRCKEAKKSGSDLKPETTREKLSQILIKWSMPTRQVAIDEIMGLIDEAIDIVSLDQYKKGISDSQKAIIEIADKSWEFMEENVVNAEMAWEKLYNKARQSERLALREKVEKLKKCTFEPDGEFHGCYNGCEGTVQNCRKCHRDICSSENCPNGKSDNGYNEHFNKALSEVLNLIQ